MKDNKHLYPWDQASPGNTCTEVGVGRSLRGERATSNQRHLVAIRFDLQTFYDCIDHGLLEQCILDASFPLKIALLAVQAYQARRYLAAEDQVSQGITSAIRILAGCALATMMARGNLGPKKRLDCQLEQIRFLSNSIVSSLGALLQLALLHLLLQGFSCSRYTVIEEVSRSTQVPNHSFFPCCFQALSTTRP